MNSLRRFVFRISIIALCINASLFAGNTGKIVGKVTDAQSGDPLPGVNVQVVTTTRGANTDLDGKYAIIGVPIGTYSVKASFIGYQEVEIQGVKVGADETTNLDFKLSQSAVDLPTVIITADQKLVNSLTTSSTQTVSSKAIEQIPNVKDVQDVIRLQAGVVKQGNNLFLRGGRANEVQYLVDGIPTNNILSNSGAPAGTANAELKDYYSGVQAGTIGGGSTGVEISANAIQSVSVQTSGFDADYGNAQSGIVNIVTKSGSDKYSASVQYRTDRMASNNQNEAYSSFSFGGPEPISKYLVPGFPGSLTFFVNSDITRSDGAYQYVHNEFYNPIERRAELNGFLGGFLNGLGFRYQDNQTNKFTLNTKLRWDISGSDQVTYGYRTSLSSNHDFSNIWKYRADSSSLRSKLSSQNVLSWTHFFSTNSFIRLYLGSLSSNDGSNVAGLKPYEYSAVENYQDPNNDGFNDLGTAQGWSSSKTRVYTARFDFNSQVHPLHMLKTGFEFNYEEINSTEIQYPTVSAEENSITYYPPFPDSTTLFKERSRGEYPGYGRYRWVLNNFPNRGALYVQDNIEFSGLNIHLGLRYDYLDIGKQVYDQDFIDKWNLAVNGFNLPEDKQLKADWAERDVNGDFVRFKNGNSFLYYFTHGYISPRLSIGYPVTDRIVFYFNYGHFLQYPDRDHYYRDPYILGADGNFVGNPSLKPQKTISYEAGFEDQFTDDMAFKLNAYYRDIFDLSDLIPRTGTGNSVYRNLDYASARGFEATVNQSLTGNFSTSVSYTYQLAKGRSSSPFASIYTPQFQLPRETRLDWDQEHTVNFFATYRVTPREEGTFFGLPFVNNYGISLTWSLGSGLPYTPFVAKTTQKNVYLQNNEDRPYTSSMNLSIYKGLYLFDKINTVISLDVTNILNRKNVNGLGGFNTQIGRPFIYGDYNPVNNDVYSYNRFESQVPPSIFDSPRQILLGFRLSWE